MDYIISFLLVYVYTFKDDYNKEDLEKFSIGVALVIVILLVLKLL